jgi:hypothetical protein
MKCITNLILDLAQLLRLALPSLRVTAGTESDARSLNRFSMYQEGHVSENAKFQMELTPQLMTACKS